jgi:hypothetical protein
MYIGLIVLILVALMITLHRTEYADYVDPTYYQIITLPEKTMYSIAGVLLIVVGITSIDLSDKPVADMYSPGDLFTSHDDQRVSSRQPPSISPPAPHNMQITIPPNTQLTLNTGVAQPIEQDSQPPPSNPYLDTSMEDTYSGGKSKKSKPSKSKSKK